MEKFNDKIQNILELLNFKDTFKAPVEDEKVKRVKEALDETLSKVSKTELPDGTWQVNGDLDLSGLNLESLKGLYDSIVNGDFSCSSNNLTSLEGCSKIVKDNFNCYSNILTSLVGCTEDEVEALFKEEGFIYV